MHEEEVTGTFTLPGGRHYPGENAVFDASDARCEKYFGRYVGIDWDSSDYFYDYLTPYPEDWRQGDHKAICLAYDPEHQEDQQDLPAQRQAVTRVTGRTPCCERLPASAARGLWLATRPAHPAPSARRLQVVSNGRSAGALDAAGRGESHQARLRGCWVRSS